MATMICNLRRLFESEYDFVFLQQVGHYKLGAHDSVKAPTQASRKDTSQRPHQPTT